MKTYLGTPGKPPVVVFVDEHGEGHVLPLHNETVNHADRFGWGDGSQRSSQLAFAILFDYFEGDVDQARAWCHPFKWKVLCDIERNQSWEITTKQIELALQELRQELDRGKVYADAQ